MATILIVDSIEGDAAVLASALRVEGFTVEHATTPARAREIVAKTPVTLALVDLMLRDAHGLEFARELRASSPYLRVVLTSAYLLSERQLARTDCGVSGFIPKPYDLTEVVAFVSAKASAPPSTRRLSSVPPRGASEEEEAPVSTITPRDGIKAAGNDPLPTLRR